MMVIKDDNKTYDSFVHWWPNLKMKKMIRNKIKNAKFSEFCNQLGIDYKFYAPRTSQQNVVMEMKNRILVDITRTILIDVGIDKNFWTKAINTTCYVINRCLIRSILEKTPYEFMTKRKPKMSYIKSFSCICFILNNRKKDLEKFDLKKWWVNLCRLILK